MVIAFRGFHWKLKLVGSQVALESGPRQVEDLSEVVVVGLYLACPAGASFQPCPSSALYLLLCAGTQFLPARRSQFSSVTLSGLLLAQDGRINFQQSKEHQISRKDQELCGRAWIGRELTAAIVFSLIDTEEQRDVVQREGNIMKHIVSRNLLFLLLLVPCLPDDQVCPLLLWL